MELEIIRTYHTEGTNGALYVNGRLQCYTIELPWLDNQHQVSCIPEGRYELIKRYSKKFGPHFLVTGVHDRSDILVHPANDALKELKGCIAPVTILTGAGKGNESRLALEGLNLILFAGRVTPSIFLTIKK
jgi:hypothetical protein